MTKYKCVRCGDEYTPITKKEKRAHSLQRHCPYCQAVICDDGQEIRWPPMISKHEFKELQKERGAYIIKKPID